METSGKHLGSRLRTLTAANPMVTVADLRVFCTEEGGGNRLGVVFAAKQLRSVLASECTGMARSGGYNEVIVAHEGEWEKNKWLKVRIFTPVAELDFAGHPLVGLAWYYSSTKGLHEVWKIKTPATEVFAWADRDFGWIRLPPPPIEPGPKDTFAVLEALRAEALDISPLVPLAKAGYGKPYLIVAFAQPERVLELEPDLDALENLADTREGVYCFAMRGSQVTARFFAPALGIPEDPGTGSAAIALAAFLSRYWRNAPRDFVVHQGHRTPSPCEIFVRRPEHGIEIGGRVVYDGDRQL